MVAGKRVRTIDVHAHCVIPEASKLLGPGPANTVRGGDEVVIDINKRFAAMDAQAVDMEVLSINPNWYDRDRDLAGQVVKIQNEKLAELCASKSDRFAGFASLTLQAPDLAVQELETAIKKQGLKGAAIGGNVNGVAFSDAKFNPVWAKAEELGASLFIHPQGIPELNKLAAGNGWLANAVAYPNRDLAGAVAHDLRGNLRPVPQAEGDRRAWRRVFCRPMPIAPITPAWSIPGGCNPDIKLKKQPTEYLKQIYFDSLVFTPEAIRHLVAQVGASQLVLGSDYPFPWQLEPVDHIFACTSLSDHEKADILGRTAAKLLGVEA